MFCPSAVGTVEFQAGTSAAVKPVSLLPAKRAGFSAFLFYKSQHVTSVS
jgi:hypothetical protein